MFRFRQLLYGFKQTNHSAKDEVGKQFKKKRRQELLYNIGIYGSAFGLAWAAVPFYKLFCEHVGIEGNVEKKDYSMKGKKMEIFRKFRVEFKGESDPSANWEFHPIQTDVIVHAGETALMFYRAYNKENYPVVGYSTYQVFPEDASLYFSKIQCFCFNQQLLNAKEELQLPIYFYLEPEILDDPVLRNTENIRIMYRFFKSKNQDLASLADQELKSIKKNKMILQKMREQKKQGCITEQEMKDIKNLQFTQEEIENFDEWAYDNPLEASEANEVLAQPTTEEK